VRGWIAGGVLVVGVAVAAVVAVGSAGAQGDPTSVVGLVNEVGEQIRRLEEVESADGRTNTVWAVGGLAGVGLGIAVGSVASYVGWRR
jgi:hypothetical protein